MTDEPRDRRVPAYLGRVLDTAGDGAGTCFQIAPGLVATAWHVLEDIGAGAVGADIAVDPLAGGARIAGVVAAIDPPSDLAAVRLAAPLPAVVGGLAATDDVALNEPVVIAGVARIDDEVATRYLSGPGSWGGAQLRADRARLGWLSSKTVMPGMSGAPVRRLRDDIVVGVVSGRYNSADGWLRDTVWVARCERLRALCADVAPLALETKPIVAPIDLLLTVDAERVHLVGADVDVSAEHGGVGPGLANAVDETRRARANAGALREVDDEIARAPGRVALDRASRLLSRSFLPAPVADALSERLERAEHAHQPLRLGIACALPTLARLPWEALADPRTDGPLALRPLVTVHRRVSAGTPAAVPGPLRILVAISSPDESGGPLLDYERELRNVLTAVGAARDGSAHVRVVPFATTAQIRAALEVDSVHVLHVSGHGSPGSLMLEHDDGREREIDADTFVDEAIPPGRMPAVIALAACYTNVARAADAPSFAARLAERGAAIVIASETSVTDVYATKAFARIYGHLAEAGVPDAVAAVGEARRAVQAELDATTHERDRTIAGLGEWAVLSLLAGAGEVAILDPHVTQPPPPAPKRFGIGRVTARAAGEFVGRRRAQRRWPGALLAAGRAGLVLHGIGGIGKTTLAAELVTRVVERERTRQVAVLEGEVDVERVLMAIVATLRKHLILTRRHTSDAATALEQAARGDLPWADRLALLRGEPTVAGVPLLVVLDNFEDNLDRHAGGAGVSAPALADLLSAIVREPGTWRLLVTTRYAFGLPDDGARALTFHPVPALSAAETRKLVWSLPALDRLLDDDAVERVWRMIGGHPRSLEYLDALLSDGGGRYPDIERRLEAALHDRLGSDAPKLLKAEWELDTAIAQVATIAADEVLLGDLLSSLSAVPGARELLIGASVYREPVDVNALLFQVGEPDEAAAYVPDRGGAEQEIVAIVEAGGIAIDGRLDVAQLPADVQAAIAPHVAEFGREPQPPRRSPEHLDAQLNACTASTLLSLDVDGEHPVAFVHPWTASELERLLADAGDLEAIAAAHRRAAAYWRWRVNVWPQDRDAAIHDLLEARHHLLAASDPDGDGAVTETIFASLRDTGAWDQADAIARDTLSRVQPDSDRAAVWIGNLGALAFRRGDLTEAEAHYQRRLDIYERLGYASGIATAHHGLGMIAYGRGDLTEARTRFQRGLDINERLGNRRGMAAGYHQLGMVAEVRGDLPEAQTQYERSLDIDERLGDQAGMANSHQNLGILAHQRGDHDEAQERYQRSLDITTRLGNQAGMALSYGQLAILASDRGDLDGAQTQFQRSLDIDERLGNQTGMASTYHNLGMLAQARGDLAEGETQYRRSLDINQRLGNRTGEAATISQLGFLAAERNELEDAIGLHGHALAIRAQIGTAEVGIDVRKLQGLRPLVSPEEFARALAATVGDDAASQIVELLHRTCTEDG